MLYSKDVLVMMSCVTLRRMFKTYPPTPPRGMSIYIKDVIVTMTCLTQKMTVMRTYQPMTLRGMLYSEDIVVIKTYPLMPPRDLPIHIEDIMIMMLSYPEDDVDEDLYPPMTLQGMLYSKDVVFDDASHPEDDVQGLPTDDTRHAIH